MIMLRKKMKPKFSVPNLGARNRKKVPDRWRAQRGIDNKKRVKKQNRGPTPSIGYKNSESVRFRRSDGTLDILVHNERELLMLAGKEESSARFAHGISTRKRAALQKLADSRNIKVVNRV